MRPDLSHVKGPVLITGGAGFIGTNLAHRLASQGTPVRLFDNLSRAGVARNVSWLRATHGDLVEVQIADTRDRRAVMRAVKDVAAVFHFAAQVAVTTSLVEPRHDFEVNVGGTLNVLEALRALDTPPPLLFTSTNKVYGALDDVSLRLTGARYEPEDDATRQRGIGEGRSLDFHSPYGCSKGAADQYVLDYARSFGLRTVVFRMSCIYGPHQMGNEDQGWVAHFLLRALEGTGLTLFGDGKQVRDVLFVEDLVDAFLAALANAGRLSGQAFNVGGGPANTLSLLELIDQIGALHPSFLEDGQAPLRFEPWRTGDQRYYVSDTSKLSKATGWSPRVGAAEGVRRLYQWLKDNPAAEPRPVPEPLAEGMVH